MVIVSGPIDNYIFLQSCSIKLKMLTNLGNHTKINVYILSVSNETGLSHRGTGNK